MRRLLCSLLRRLGTKNELTWETEVDSKDDGGYDKKPIKHMPTPAGVKPVLGTIFVRVNVLLVKDLWPQNCFFFPLTGPPCRTL